jgi:hypothetical protein
MFDRVKSYFTYSNSEKSYTEPKAGTFTTSEEICKRVNPVDKGVCWPLANLYTKYQMGNGTHDFMEGTPNEIYQAAVNERKHQEALQSQGRDGVNSAFVDSGVSYVPAFHKIEQLKTPEGVEKAVSQGQHSILTFQAAGEERLLHQLALGRDFQQADQCYFFDSNLPGGERRGDCHRLFAQTAETIKKHSHPEAKEILVATDKVNNRL